MAEDVQRPSVVGLGLGRPVEAAERWRADLGVQDDHWGVRVGPGEPVVALEEERLRPGRDRRKWRPQSINQTGFYCTDVVKQGWS